MSTRRKSTAGMQSAGTKTKATQMNFSMKNEIPRGEAKGTRSAAQPASVKEVLSMMIIFLCKKTIFFDTRLKVGLYLLTLFIISLIGGNSFLSCCDQNITDFVLLSIPLSLSLSLSPSLSLVQSLDFLPFPKTYFARQDNVFNLYFVKLGWLVKPHLINFLINN
jgi:hypothetical protein